MELPVTGGELCQSGLRRQNEPAEEEDARDSGEEGGEAAAEGPSWVTTREVLKYSRTWVTISPWGAGAAAGDTVQAWTQ